MRQPPSSQHRSHRRSSPWLNYVTKIQYSTFNLPPRSKQASLTEIKKSLKEKRYAVLCILYRIASYLPLANAVFPVTAHLIQLICLSPRNPYQPRLCIMCPLLPISHQRQKKKPAENNNMHSQQPCSQLPNIRLSPGDALRRQSLFPKQH